MWPEATLIKGQTRHEKRALYLEALRDYLAERVATQIRVLSAEASPLRRLEACPQRVRNRRIGRKSSSCTGIGAICEFGRSDLEIAALSDAARRPLISAIRHRIEEASRKARSAPEWTRKLRRNS